MTHEAKAKAMTRKAKAKAMPRKAKAMTHKANAKAKDLTCHAAYMYKLKLLSWHNIVSNPKYFIGFIEFVVQFCCTFKASALDV